MKTKHTYRPTPREVEQQNLLYSGPLSNTYFTGALSNNFALYYDQRSVGQSVLVSGTHLWPATNFFPSHRPRNNADTRRSPTP
jgi:hypothetical protein